MNKDEVIEYLQERVDKLKRDEPYATTPIEAYERVIQELVDEE